MIIAIILLMGCAKPQDTDEIVQPSISPVAGDAYAHLVEQDKNRVVENTYTVGVISEYKMKYSDDTYDTYDFDGVLEVDGDEAHFIQYLNANGMNSEIQGYYYDDRLYATYNNVSYYEDMSLNDVRASMVSPLEPFVFQEDTIEKITVGTDENKNWNYVIQLNNESANDLFASRYDIRGLNQLDDYKVVDNQIIYRFDDTHYLGEETIFHIEITYQNQPISVEYVLKTNYMRFLETDITINDSLKEMHSAYVNYQDIDTSAIETQTQDDDSEEDSVEETFKKRLVSRLNYEEEENNRYINKYNENEAYTVDFNNKVFIYTNYSLDYSYSWKGDIGSMGGCTYDFAIDSAAESCEDKTIETIKNIKSFLQMELYYCGLSLDGLMNEANE